MTTRLVVARHCAPPLCWAERSADGSHWRVQWCLGVRGQPPLRCLPGALAADEVQAFIDAYERGFADGLAQGRALGRATLQAELRALLGAAADEARTGGTGREDRFGAAASEARSL